MRWNAKLYNSKHNFVADYGMELLNYVPLDRTQKILDLGCGTGVLTNALSHKSAHVLGVDSSFDMVDLAKQTYPNLHFQVINALDMPYKNEFDIIFSNAVFHWIGEQELLLHNVYEALKPGGSLVCELGARGNVATIEKGFAYAVEQAGGTYHSKFTFPSVDEYKELLSKNGFRIDELYDFSRPTPLKGTEGLRDWAKQFYKSELEQYELNKQELILVYLEEYARPTLWKKEEWVADYKRLRAVAQKKTK